MGTVADKLVYLGGTKSAIKDAIVAKGVEVPEGTTFREYATKINSITSGSGVTVPTWSYEVPLVSSLNPTVGSTPFTYSSVAFEHVDQYGVWQSVAASTPVFDYGGCRVFQTIGQNYFGTFTSGSKTVSGLSASSTFILCFCGTGTVSWDGGAASLTGTGVDTLVFTSITGNTTYTFEITGSVTRAMFYGQSFVNLYFSIAPFKVPLMFLGTSGTQFMPRLNPPLSVVLQSGGTMYFEVKYPTTGATTNTFRAGALSGSGTVYRYNMAGRTTFSNNSLMSASDTVWHKVAVSWQGAAFCAGVIDGVHAGVSNNTNSWLFTSSLYFEGGDMVVRNFKYTTQVLDLNSIIALTT